MTLRSLVDTFVGYEDKNQETIWDGTWVFIRKDVIFNESKFRYKNKTSLKLLRENATTDLVTLAGMF